MTMNSPLLQIDQDDWLKNAGRAAFKFRHTLADDPGSRSTP